MSSISSCTVLVLSLSPLTGEPASPTEKLLVEPGVGRPEGETELDRIVGVWGMSRGIGLLPAGEDEGCWGELEGRLGVVPSTELGEPSGPGGRVPLPFCVTVVPFGSVTLTSGEDSAWESGEASELEI